MKKPRFRVSTARRVRYPVHGAVRTSDSEDMKRGGKGIKKLSDKGKDRIAPCKTKR